LRRALTEAELGTILSRITTSARRFEIRDRYNSEVGREAFRRFLAGEPDDYARHQSWLDKLRHDHAAGKRWQRIRIVSTGTGSGGRWRGGTRGRSTSSPPPTAELA
jgi:hypothetical protein